MNKTVKTVLFSAILLVELAATLLATDAWLYYSQTYSWGDKRSKETVWGLCVLGGLILVVITIALAARKKKQA